MANVSIYKHFKIACVCLLIIFNFQCPLFSFAQSDADRMFKKYTTRDGMLNNSVYAMERSKNGLWWIGTAEAFNALTDIVLKTGRKPGISQRLFTWGCKSIFEDSQTNVWVFNLGFPYVFPSGSKKYQLVEIDSTRKLIIRILT